MSGQIIIQASGQELLQPSVTAQHTERRIPGTEKILGRRHGVAQHHRQPQVTGHQDIRAQQPTQAALRGQQIVSAADRGARIR